MSVTIKRNLILLALAGVFLLVAKLSLDDLATNGVESLAVFPFIVCGLGFLASTVALIVRLWGTEKE